MEILTLGQYDTLKHSCLFCPRGNLIEPSEGQSGSARDCYVGENVRIGMEVVDVDQIQPHSPSTEVGTNSPGQRYQANSSPQAGLRPGTIPKKL